MTAKEMLAQVFPWRLQRRSVPSRWARIICGAVAVLVALALTLIIFQLAGLDSLAIGKKVIISTFGKRYGIEQAFVLATPLLLTGLAVALGLKMGLWNVGAEGQLFVGAIAATAVGLFVKGPTALMLILMFLAAAAAGALWVLLPAVTRAVWNVNEILTTLMLNFVAQYLTVYFVMNAWHDAIGAVLIATARVPYELPILTGSMHIGFLIGTAIAVLLFLALRGTRWGYEISIIGGNRRAAEFAGIPVARHIITTLMLSGAIAGMAGAIEISGTVHRLSMTISMGYGFFGIVVAAIAGTSMLAIVPVAFLLAVLLNGGIVAQTQGLSVNAMVAVNGLIVLFVAIGEVAANYSFVRLRKAESTEGEGIMVVSQDDLVV
jgi:ABC-type uncharacterized transport system permease subunit